MRDPFENPAPLIKSVYAFVAYRIGDGHDADEITSETFERALRYRDSFDPKRGEPIGWLIGIARRCIADAALRRVVPAEPRDSIHDGHEEQSIRRVHLARALSQLEDREREILALRYGADLTARQLGEVLGIKTNTAEVALHRALARLRTILEVDGSASPDAPSVALGNTGS